MIAAGEGRTMDIIYLSSAAVRRLFAQGVFVLAIAGLLTGCAHTSRPSGSREALSPAEHVSLGLTYQAQGLRAEAVSQYKAAVRRDPAFAEGWLALGNMAFTDGRNKEAERCFRKALKASPHHPGASNNLAMVIMARNGSLPEAEALVRDALLNAGALRPYVLDTLANIYIRERRYAEATTVIGQAEAETPPENRLVRNQLLETRKNIYIAQGITQ
jgi:tetratricopeptide (TPR) repeat protein